MKSRWHTDADPRLTQDVRVGDEWWSSEGIYELVATGEWVLVPSPHDLLP